ncbi:MAG: NosR/NirI family protein [Burkholderiaceae bacterium]|nr:NosR/NirI family protein [Burkholderiaceae bacterium]
MTPHVAAVPGPNRRRLVTFAVWATLFWIAAACGPVFGQNRPALLDSFLARLSAADVFPGADRFGPVQGSPPVAPVFRGNERVGFAWLNSDFVDSRGYSSKPIHVVVALDNDGTIVGLKIVQHSEPILMVGVPEKRIVQSLNTYLGFNPVRARAAGSGPPKADIVSGATATVLILGESVVRSANRVARRLQLGTGVASAAAPNAPGASGAAASATASGAAASATASGAAASGAAAGRAASAPPIARANARVVDPEAGAVTDWKTLRRQGAIAHLRVTVGDVTRAFAESGNADAAKLTQTGDPNAVFIDLYAALVSQPAIARSLLDPREYADLLSRLAPGQQAVLVAASGQYSFKGSAWFRGGIFDRIALVQGVETIRFWDRHHLRVGRIVAPDAPDLREIGVFAVPEGAEFDPAAPWRLQLLVQRQTGALDQAFVSFSLPYTLPERYTRAAPASASAPPQAEAAAAGSSATSSPAASAAAVPAGSGGQPAVTGSAGQPAAAGSAGQPAVTGSAPSAEIASAREAAAEAADEADQAPLWRRIWESRAAAIAVLVLMLGALTIIFFFQNLIVPHEKVFDRIRLVFLAVTLFWLGWIAQAQLSVVNVLTFTSSLRTGFLWESFLVDPLIFILWCAVAAGLLFWGRGPFCGWLCPFGALQELTNRAAKALNVPQLKIPWGVHERLWPIKYIVFLGLFGVSLGSLIWAERLAEIEPFKTAIVLRFVREWWFVAFALALLAAGLFVERFFCRYLCPLGAALAIPGRMRMFDWLRRYRECGNPCMRCFNECPVEAIHPEGHINPNECISCLHCQVLYHHDRKCPVRIQRRLKREKREAMARPAASAVVEMPVTVHRRMSDPT